MSLIRTTCFAAIPVMFTAACVLAQETEPPPAPEDATPVAPALAVDPEVSFEVVEQGAEPRRTLRYDLGREAKQRTELRIEISAETSVNGAPMPAEDTPSMTMHLDVDVADEENGDYIVVSRIEEVGVEEDDSPLRAQMMRQALEEMVGVTSRSRVDSRGVLQSTMVEAPEEADAQAMQMARGMEEPMTQLGVHFPEEAIGEGARWTVTMPRVSDGIRMVQTIEYELASIEGDVVELRINMTQTAERQPMGAGELPPGMEVELVSLSGEGSGTARVDLRRPAALEATLESTSEIEIHAREGEAVQEMSRTMRNKIEMRSEDRE